VKEAYEKRICDYIAENNIQAEHLSFEQSCHSVAEAAEAVAATPQDFVKNICLLTPDNRLVVAIVKGEDRASLPNIAAALGVEGKMRLATPEEILALSGYPCGGTPSFGFDALFLFDERVFEKQVVYTGGGSETSLIKASPAELRRVNKGMIAYLRK
jgi:Cys-tRNA(Pro)/Cys-tRNA(Cys) deacylase